MASDENGAFKFENVPFGDYVVEQTEKETVFYMRSAGSYTELLRIRALTDTDRESQAEKDDFMVLHKGNTVIYVAKLTEYAIDQGITEEMLISQFYPIRAELMTEED